MREGAGGPGGESDSSSASSGAWDFSCCSSCSLRTFLSNLADMVFRRLVRALTELGFGISVKPGIGDWEMEANERKMVFYDKID